MISTLAAETAFAVATPNRLLTLTPTPLVQAFVGGLLKGLAAMHLAPVQD